MNQVALRAFFVFLVKPIQNFFVCMIGMIGMIGGKSSR